MVQFSNQRQDTTFLQNQFVKLRSNDNIRITHDSV